MRTLKLIFALAVLAFAGGIAFVYSGIYPVGADVPHNAATHWALETLRERSIAKASADIAVPKLDDPQLLMAGGADCNEMCAGCHLKPGKGQSDLNIGLYPQPPNLSLANAASAQRSSEESKVSAARQFWIIKHGIKASAMPAWGPSHDDKRIWAMVAFLQQLQRLSPDQYQILTVRVPGDAEAHADSGHHDAAAAAATVDSHPVGTDNPIGVVDQFQKALAAGDTASASALLDPKVAIFESGSIERSRDEYASHHLAADAEFMKGATLSLLSRTGDSLGDMAWVASESKITATADGKPAKLVSIETMVLKKGAEGWRIVHIHWSSKKEE